MTTEFVVARDGFPNHHPEEALATILDVSPKLIAESLEKYFPSFAVLAMMAASDGCVNLRREHIKVGGGFSKSK